MTVQLDYKSGFQFGSAQEVWVTPNPDVLEIQVQIEGLGQRELDLRSQGFIFDIDVGADAAQFNGIKRYLVQSNAAQIQKNAGSVHSPI